jgi:hypothetical protein
MSPTPRSRLPPPSSPSYTAQIPAIPHSSTPCMKRVIRSCLSKGQGGYPWMHRPSSASVWSGMRIVGLRMLLTICWDRETSSAAKDGILYMKSGGAIHFSICGRINVSSI